ncbi:hypothetical protein [Shewanella surugensis]|uniref:Fungal lipase-like domain-containing protein n=1 Tax=Shewanella surugensis TaxID=212020 RepID=A0ABT0LHX0_9GAMM|nr:hypothetical protein [Shewanella surugensis]MCL1127293.1 hypothetical protein [Shewanella surugensis]
MVSPVLSGIVSPQPNHEPLIQIENPSLFNPQSQSTLSGLKQIQSQTESSDSLSLGQLHTPMGGQYSAGNLISTLGRGPGNILRVCGEPLTHYARQQWASEPTEASILNNDRVLGKALNASAFAIGSLLTATGNVLNGAVGAAAGVICLAETLLTRVFYACQGHDMSVNARMPQQALPDNRVQEAYHESRLCAFIHRQLPINSKFLPTNSTESSTLPPNHRIAELDEIPEKWRHAFNPDTGIITPDTWSGISPGVYIDENKLPATLKLVFHGIIDAPSGRASVTNSLFSDSFMRTSAEIAADFNRHLGDTQSPLNIKLVGHSLGGGAVEYAGAMTGIATSAYNSAGLSALSRSEIGIDRINNADITNINTQGDWVSQTMLRKLPIMPRAQIGAKQFIFKESLTRTKDAHMPEAMSDGLKERLPQSSTGRVIK